MSINESVGAQVRHLRQAQGMTQQDLAQKSGLSVDHIGKIERGSTSPTVEALVQIAGGLTVTVQSLLDLHEGASPEETTSALAEFTRYLRQKSADDVAFAQSIVRQILDR